MTRRWRSIGLFVLGAVVGGASAFLIHATREYLRLRGTTVTVPFRQADNVVVSATPQEMRLWPGKAPGSENWTQQETIGIADRGHMAFNVVDPTLTAYFPPAGTANGTSIIICPGGVFYMVSIENEGEKVASYLNSLGITAFVLRYRVARTSTSFYPAERHVEIPGDERAVFEALAPLMTADGRQAVRIVRSHAAKWGLDPHRIGVLGFSSGGYIALSLGVHRDPDSMPDFIAPMYAVPPTVPDAKPDPIPMFLVCADDDAVADCIQEYDLWHGSGVPVELHLFVRGGHGFSLRKQNLPSDAWPELFEHWLRAERYLPAAGAK